MIKKVTVAIIGGGLLGCFVARNLRRYKIDVAVIEKNSDVCAEISRANTSIIYSGYDNKPGSLKASMSVSANRDFDRLCKELSVPYKCCGSLMTAAGPRGEEVLQKKMAQGKENGVSGLRLLSASEARTLEPELSHSVTKALYSQATGTVNPWELGLAALENALDNGAELFLETEVTSISAEDDGYLLQTNKGSLFARSVVNCAGLFTDKISEMVAPPYFKILPTRGDYIILDTKAQDTIQHIIFLEPEESGKGATLVPTVDGNIMLGPSEEDLEGEADFGVTSEGLSFVQRSSKEIVPRIPLEQTIRSFATLRPNPYWAEVDAQGNLQVSKRSINDFFIGSPEGHPFFINVPGVKTPGLTCSNEIGRYVTELLVERLGDVKTNPDFDPQRVAQTRFSRMSAEERKELHGSQCIVCRCKEVTEEEIRNSIKRTAGAKTLDGVKRRTGAQMGRCQGGFCTQRIVEILAEEQGVSISDIRKDREGSYLISK